MFLRSHWFFSLRSNTSSISSSITLSGMLSSTCRPVHTRRGAACEISPTRPPSLHRPPSRRPHSRCRPAERRRGSVRGRCRTWGGGEAPGERRDSGLEKRRTVGLRQLGRHAATLSMDCLISWPSRSDIRPMLSDTLFMPSARLSGRAFTALDMFLMELLRGFTKVSICRCRGRTQGIRFRRHVMRV